MGEMLLSAQAGSFSLDWKMMLQILLPTAFCHLYGEWGEETKHSGNKKLCCTLVITLSSSLQMRNDLSGSLAILTGNAEDRQHQKESVKCRMGPDEKEKQGSKVTCDCQWHDGGSHLRWTRCHTSHSYDCPCMCALLTLNERQLILCGKRGTPFCTHKRKISYT